MRTVRISEEVWESIAQRGKFGETVDDVLRRLLNLGPPNSEVQRKERRRIPSRASQKMSARVHNGMLTVSFEDGGRENWTLPARTDIAGIKRLTREAMEFAEQHKASEGQLHAVRKALTDAEYWVTKNKGG